MLQVIKIFALFIFSCLLLVAGNLSSFHVCHDPKCLGYVPEFHNNCCSHNEDGVSELFTQIIKVPDTCLFLLSQSPGQITFIECENHYIFLPAFTVVQNLFFVGRVPRTLAPSRAPPSLLFS